MAEWTNLTTTSAVELAAQAELQEPAAGLAEEGLRPEPFVERLREEGLYSEAIAVMARALPTREAIGWACLCDRSTTPEDDDPRHAELLGAVEQWVREPTDEHRRAALELAQDEPDQDSGQMLGMATGYSAGKVQVGNNPPVDVPTDTVPPMIAGAVMIAAGRVEASEAEQTRREFVQRAVEVAAGRSGRIPGDG